MLAILWPLVSWIFRGVVVKFLILTAVFAVMTIVIPVAIAIISPYIGVGSINSAFGSLDSGVWWFLDMFALDYGLPLILSAFVARFLIRRLPLIG
jgi:hypothetical protein